MNIRYPIYEGVYRILTGYLTTEYQKYTPYEGSLVWMSSGNYTFIGPTKAKISLVWLITKKRGRK